MVTSLTSPASQSAIGFVSQSRFIFKHLKGYGLNSTVQGKPSIKRDKWDVLITNGNSIGKVEIAPKQINKQQQYLIFIYRKSNNDFPNVDLHLKAQKLEQSP